ncbi:MAG: hypothetical protein JWO80_3267 [Bryobacterales bacterium]|nr:hypothetical protein [Bryobacterales bacterium]
MGRVRSRELGAGANAEVEETDETVEDAEVIEVDAQESTVPKAKGTKTTYKPRVPQYLHELDLTRSGTSLRILQRPRSRKIIITAIWLPRSD